MTHVIVPEEHHRKLNMADDFIRISIRLEDTQDLFDDIESALQYPFLNIADQ